MDIRPLAEAVMETAGKIKNDNMSDQDFYKFKLNKIAARWPAKAVAQLSFSQ